MIDFAKMNVGDSHPLNSNWDIARLDYDQCNKYCSEQDDPKPQFQVENKKTGSKTWLYTLVRIK